MSEYIRINTSNPPGNETAAAKWFAQIFHRAEETHRLAPFVNGANLLLQTILLLDER